MVRNRSRSEDRIILCIAIPLVPIYLAGLCVVKTYRCFRNHPPGNERVLVKRRKKYPKPLPYTRQSNLTELQLHPDTANPSSRLLALPYSVRLRIYNFLLANRYIIELTDEPHRLIHAHTLYPDNWANNQHLPASSAQRVLNFPHYSQKKPRHGLPITLLQSCRQIYQECIPLLYGTNTFCVRQLDTLIFLDRCIRPQHLAQISYLQMQWAFTWTPFVEMAEATPRPYNTDTWVRFWNIVATRLTGLKGLDASISVPKDARAEEKIWCEPIRQIRGLDHFILNIMYPITTTLSNSAAEADSKAYRRELESCVTMPREPKEKDKAGLTIAGMEHETLRRRKKVAIVKTYWDHLS